ncbi:MAG: Glutamate synthase (NADPH) small chain [Bacteroidetes bacterium ADurb.Bin408]|nr:MAG: Glutamate synthase (NADPH) small chain [Bacteroidetes bacterium ADurb.Bin408]
MYYAAEGNFNEAFKTILKTNPFPNVLGMVCDHKCQTKCTRVNYDEVLRIRDVKWFVSENNNNGYKEELPLNGIKVAVIGAGPSGLSCAYFLRLAGVEVTVYESKSISGGMASEAIPRFRLKEKALQKDIDRIKNLGVHIHYNAKIDHQSYGFIKNEYHYIYIAVGAQKIKKLNIPGDNAEGIIDPIEFLSSLKRNAPLSLGENVAVVGGGNTAVDVARAVLRVLKDRNKVTMVYRRTLNDMPAEKEEIEALLEEGIKVIELSQPVMVLTDNNKVKGMKCVKMQLSGKDSSGRGRVVPVPDSEHILYFDCIIPALGQETNIDFLTDDELKTVTHDKITPAKLFIGGDAYRGASTIVQAVADGKEAALKVIDAINYKKETISNKVPEISYEKLLEKRAIRQFSALPKPNANQNEADAPELPYSEKQIMAEASRCLLCHQLCNICVTVCPNKANYCYITEPLSFTLSKIRMADNKPVIEKDKTFCVKQKYQIINISDFCNECGNCRTFCPTADAPYTHKPKFYLTPESFRNAPEGFYFTKTPEKKALVYKKEDKFFTLSMINGQYVFENDQIKASFSQNNFSLMKVELLSPFEGYLLLDKAAEMLLLFKAAENLY